MSKPAARIGDMHMCPMVTPGMPPIPHVGGPITGPGCPTVLIGGMHAAVMGDMCTCIGPPDSVILGSMTVLIGGKPAARMGDSSAHGGMISVGCPTVLIGDSGSSGGAGGGSASVAPPTKAINSMTGSARTSAAQTSAFRTAASKGSPFVHSAPDCSGCGNH